MRKSLNTSTEVRTQVQIKSAYKDDCRRLRAAGSKDISFEDWQDLNQERIKKITEWCSDIRNIYKKRAKQARKSSGI